MEWNPRPASLWEWDNLFELDQKKPAPASQDFSPGGGISSGDTTGSSVSASMTSSSFGDSKPFTLDGFEQIPPRGSKQPKSSSSPAEPFLSLKLGKSYFKDMGSNGTTAVAAGDAEVTTAAKTPVTSASSSGKRMKALSCTSGVAAPPRCQVEGCNLELTSAKDYHRKHRICENHSKSPRVVVAGIERRFCQQCSRFHALSEFDEKKRSCRRRLSDHNARRRKPQPEAVRLNPSRFSSIYDEPKMNMVFDQSPRLFSGNFSWDHSGAVTTMPPDSSGMRSSHRTGFSWDHTPKAIHHTKEYLSRPASGKSIGVAHHHHHQGQIFGNITSTSSTTMLYPNAASTNKSTAPEFLHPAMEESELNASQDLHRGHSLLSSNAWGARETKPVPSQVQQHLAPLASSEFWETEPANLSLPRGTGHAANFQDLQLFKPAPSDPGFYSYQFN